MFSGLALAETNYDSLAAENTKTATKSEVTKDPDIITDVYQLQYASADKIKQCISEAGLGVKIVADQRTNSVIVTGREDDIQKVGRIVELLDVGVSDKSPIFAEYAQTVEDTDVMAAVIDKTMEKAFSGEYREIGGFFDTGCQGVFLKNYGVLFMMNVGFSVTKPPEEKKAQEAKPNDLWDQTRREITEQTRFNGSEYGSTWTVEPSDSYDQAKVERLKNELLKQIGDYANNIRNLGTDDNITIVIKGRKNPDSLSIYGIFNAPKTGVNIGTSTPAVPEIATSIATTPSEPTQPIAVTGSVSVSVAAPSAVPPSPPQLGIETPSVEGANNAPEATLPSLSEQRATGIAVQEAQRANMKAYDLQQKANELQKRTYEIQSKIGDFVYPNQMFPRGAKTTMIISVKKRNVMEFKEGRINFDEFAKRAEITQY
jgi:hypothetical protein